ncbi:MAG: SDR family NAD(P)-dependent oxidoreductase [Syntrophobacteraceae bacterium]
MHAALITGASRGLGYELCRQLTNRGWKVGALSRTQSEGLVRLERASEGRFRWFECDVADPSAEMAAHGALQFLGSLNLLINNAGIPGWSQKLAATEVGEVETLFDIHALGCLRITRAAISALLATKDAHIVNISSRLGSISRTASGEFAGKGFSYSYRIAKAALNMLSACIAEEFAPHGIRVTVLHPGRFQSGAAASGATMTAKEAAQRICRWLPTRDRSPIVYLEPEAGNLPW